MYVWAPGWSLHAVVFVLSKCWAAGFLILISYIFAVEYSQKRCILADNRDTCHNSRHFLHSWSDCASILLILTSICEYSLSYEYIMALRVKVTGVLKYDDNSNWTEWKKIFRIRQLQHFSILVLRTSDYKPLQQLVEHSQHSLVIGNDSPFH